MGNAVFLAVAVDGAVLPKGKDDNYCVVGKHAPSNMWLANMHLTTCGWQTCTKQHVVGKHAPNNMWLLLVFSSNLCYAAMPTIFFTILFKGSKRLIGFLH